MAFATERNRLVLAVLIPVGALAAQWVLWPYISPFVWFLFFPALFYSARVGGLRGGLLGALVSVLQVWYFFMPPQLSWQMENPANFWSIGLFLMMGYLIGDAHERLGEAQRRTEVALAETSRANEEITHLYQQTRELDELKSQFFANVSHELRTPLTLILGPLAKRLARDDLPEAERREAELMQRNARLLYRHVSDLLDAAKLEAGSMTASFARLDLAALVRATAAHFDSLAAERHIAYTVAVPESLMAEADGEKIQRILLNLLSNAFKFIADGGAVAVRLAARDGAAVIEVQDDGPGVPADMREAVFERFRQVEGDPRRRFGGTGLGLAIVKEFAELHGGGARVEAAPGGGALLVVELPLKAPAGTVLAAAPTLLDENIDRQAVDELRPAAVQADPAAGAGADAPLVLVVDDNADMRAFIAEALGSRFRIACAVDGQDGLERARALHPDLILADVMMPRLSGDQMVIELRRETAFARVPIVMLTAKADDELRLRMLQAGVQDYLNKPFAVEELLARVGGLVAERKRRQLEVNRYEQIVATSGDMLAFIDRDGRYLVANPAYANLFRATPADLHGRRVEDVVGAAAYAVIAPRIEGALAGGRQRFIAEPELPGGSRPVFDAEYRPFRQDGQVQGVVVSLRDISEIKAAEGELRRRNEELERFDQASVGRELEMIRLKRQVNELALELGRKAPYDIAFTGVAHERKSP